MQVSTIVQVAALKPHPRNYRVHPKDEIEHIKRSIQESGVYRNIVVAKEDTILAGHGVVQAAKELGLVEVPVVRLDVDPMSPAGMRVLSSDNEIAHLAEVDDYALANILKELKGSTEGLLGTGFDEMMLANLVLMTRPASEIPTMDAALEWVGMPAFEPVPEPLQITVSFENAADRQAFLDKVGIKLGPKKNSTWFPPHEHDSQAFKFVEGKAP